VIGWIKGRLLRKALPEVIVDVAGVGYVLSVPQLCYERMGHEGDEVELHVSTQFRSESLQLYGFSTRDEKSVFEALLNVNGVGPRLALAVLSSLSPDALRLAVAEDRPAALEKVPGIGKKTARRVLLELKDRLGDLDELVVPRTRGAGSTDAPASMRADALVALENLGYRRGEAEQAIERALRSTGEDDLAALLKASLREMGR
jgi:Holliday junction DNA helicase RuvA